MKKHILVVALGILTIVVAVLAIVFRHERVAGGVPLHYVALGLLVITAALACVALIEHRNGIHRAIKEDYAEVLRGAFDGKPALERKLNRAIAYYGRGDIGGAHRLLKELEVAAEKDADRAAVELFLGLCAEQRQDVPGAIAHYEKALAYDPNGSVSMIRLGIMDFQAGKAGEAEALLAKAYQTSPESADALSDLAIAYFEMKQPDRAIEIAEKALGLQPEMPAPTNVLALSYALKQDHEHAEEYFDKSMRSGFSQPDILRPIMDKAYQGVAEDLKEDEQATR